MNDYPINQWRNKRSHSIQLHQHSRTNIANMLTGVSKSQIVFDTQIVILKMFIHNASKINGSEFKLHVHSTITLNETKLLNKN